MTVHLILAATLKQAALTAEVDWGWQRIATNRFRMPGGEQAVVVTSGDALMGRPVGDTVVYLAHDWRSLPARDKAILDALVNSQRIERREPPTRQRGPSEAEYQALAVLSRSLMPIAMHAGPIPAPMASDAVADIATAIRLLDRPISMAVLDAITRLAEVLREEITA